MSIEIVIFIIIAAGFAYSVMQGTKFLTAKINAFRSDARLTDREFLRIGLDMAEKAIKTVAEVSVGKLEEIVAKDLRIKIKNGEAKKEDLFALAEEAYNEVIDTVKPELIQELSQSIDNVELYIRNQIENQLLLLKSKLGGGTADGDVIHS